MGSWGKAALAGAAAGAAGTTALNAVTYLDMALTARPTSSTPEQTVERLAGAAGTRVPGEGDARDNRLAGLGPLTGIVTGVGLGVVAGLARAAGVRPGLAPSAVLVGVGAMAATDGPMAALGVSDPRTWPASSWVRDLVPHLAYGAVTAAVVHALAEG